MSDIIISKDATGHNVIDDKKAIVYMGELPPYYYHTNGYYIPFDLKDNVGIIEYNEPFMTDPTVDPAKIDNFKKILQAMTEPVHLILADDVEIVEELPAGLLVRPAEIEGEAKTEIDDSGTDVKLAAEQIVVDRDQPIVPVVMLSDDTAVDTDPFDELAALFEQLGTVTHETIEFGAMKFSEVSVNEIIKFLPMLYPNMDPIVSEHYANALLGLISTYDKRGLTTVGEDLLKHKGLPSWLVPVVVANLKLKAPAIEETKKSYSIPQPPITFFDRIAEWGYEASTNTNKIYIPQHVSEPNCEKSWLHCRQDYTINIAQQAPEGIFLRRTYGDENDLNVVLHNDFVTEGNTRAQSIADKGAIKSVSCHLMAPGDDINVVGFLMRSIGSNTWTNASGLNQVNVYPLKEGLQIHELLTSIYPQPDAVLNMHESIMTKARNLVAVGKLLEYYKYDEHDLTLDSFDREKWANKFASVARWPTNISKYYKDRQESVHGDDDFVGDYKYLPVNIDRQQLLMFLNSTHDYGTTYHLLRRKQKALNTKVDKIKLDEVPPSTDPFDVYALREGKIAYAVPDKTSDEQERGSYYSIADYVKLRRNEVIDIYNESIDYMTSDKTDIDEQLLQARRTLTFLTLKDETNTKGSILKSIVVKLATDYRSTSNIVKTFELLSKELTSENHLIYVNLLDQYLEYNLISFDKTDGFYRDAETKEIICCMHYKYQLSRTLETYLETDNNDFVEVVEGVTRCRYCHVNILDEIDQLPQFAAGQLNLIHTYRDMILNDASDDAIDTMTELYTFLEFMTTKITTQLVDLDLPVAVTNKILQESYMYIKKNRLDAVDPYFMYGHGEKYQEIVEIIADALVDGVANQSMFAPSKKAGSDAFIFSNVMKHLLLQKSDPVSGRLAGRHGLLNSFISKFQKDINLWTEGLKTLRDTSPKGTDVSSLTELHNAFILVEHTYRMGVLLAFISYHSDMHNLQTHRNYSDLKAQINDEIICDLLTEYHKRRSTTLKSWRIDIIAAQKDHLLRDIDIMIELVRPKYNVKFIRAAHNLLPYGDKSASASEHLLLTTAVMYVQLREKYAEQYAQIVDIPEDKPTLPLIWPNLPSYALPEVRPDLDGPAYTEYINAISYNRYAGQQYMASMTARSLQVTNLLDTQVTYPLISRLPVDKTPTKSTINAALMHENVIPTAKGEKIINVYPKSGLAYYGSLFDTNTELLCITPKAPTIKTQSGSELFEKNVYVPYKENNDILNGLVQGLNAIDLPQPVIKPSIGVTEMIFNPALTRHTMPIASTPKNGHSSHIKTATQTPVNIRPEFRAFVQTLRDILMVMKSRTNIDIIDGNTTIDFGTLLTGSIPQAIDINKNLVKRLEDTSYLKSHISLDQGCIEATIQSILIAEKKSVEVIRSQRSWHKIRTVGKQLHFIHQWLSKDISAEEWTDMSNDREKGEYIMHENIFNIRGTKDGLTDLSAYKLNKYKPFNSYIYTASIHEYKKALASALSGIDIDNLTMSYEELVLHPEENKLVVIEPFTELFSNYSSFEVLYTMVLGLAIKLDILRQMYIIDNPSVDMAEIATVSRTFGAQYEGTSSHDYLVNIVGPIIRKLIDDTDYLDPNHEEFNELFYRDFYARVAAPKSKATNITKMLQKGELGMLDAVAKEEATKEDITGEEDEYEGEEDGLVERVDEDGFVIPDIEGEFGDDAMEGENLQGEGEAEDEYEY